jgi:tetratricopeptide (TPR) repeat protein
MVVLALAALASPALARPKRRDAKVAFDRGVLAYKKGNFEAAADALGKSFDLERDPDTLFAWAQSERKLDHCDKAIDLYEKLLAFELPAANREAVNTSLADCRAQVPAKPEPAPAVPAPTATSVASTTTAAPATAAAMGAPDGGASPETPRQTDRPAGRAWYRDPIALTLVGSGVVGVSVGAAFLVSASSTHSDFMNATTYDEAQTLLDQARSRQKIGFIATGVGAALLAGGVVWIFTHRDSAEQHTLTGWLAPGGGGLGVAGSY